MSSPDPAETPGSEFDAPGVDAKKESVMRQILDAEARLRLNNIRMVRPELASTVESYLVGLASQGQLRSRITDEQLKQILISLQQPKREFRINRR